MSRIDTIHQTILANHTTSMDILKRTTPGQWEIPAPSDEGHQSSNFSSVSPNTGGNTRKNSGRQQAVISGQ